MGLISTGVSEDPAGQIFNIYQTKWCQIADDVTMWAGIFVFTGEELEIQALLCF
jgi:hypothetical protein